MRSLLALALVACSGPSAPNDAGRDAGAVPADAGRDAAPYDAGNPCDSIDGLDRSCTFGDDSTCAAALHQVDCCGTYVSIGIGADERARFANLERLCEGTYPACDCPPGPTTTDSGETYTDPAAIVMVGCIAIPAGTQCMTYLLDRPPDQR